MSREYSCAEITSWLLQPGSSLSAEQAKDFEEHLESCPGCQTRLDWSPGPADPLLNLARQVGDPTMTPVDTALNRVVAHLHEVRSPVRSESTEPADLYFLGPAPRPDLLGMLGNYEVQEVIGQG